MLVADRPDVATSVIVPNEQVPDVRENAQDYLVGQSKRSVRIKKFNVNRKLLHFSTLHMGLAVGIVSIWFAYNAWTARRQMHTVVQIEQLGCDVGYASGLAECLDGMLPFDYVYSVNQVTVRRFDAKFETSGDLDRLMKCLQALPRLESLILWENHRHLVPRFRRAFPHIEIVVINEAVVG